MRTDVERVKLGQQVEPAEASQNGRNGEHPGQRRPEHTHRKPSRFSWQRLALLLACLVWLAVGVQGASQYGHAYWVYRGFEPPKDPPGISPGRLIVQHFYSPSLKEERSFKVYLPPGYVADSAAGRRFPVVYILHGSPGGPAQITDVGPAGGKLDQPVLRPVHHKLPMHVFMYAGSAGKIVPHVRLFGLQLRADGADVKFAVYPGHHDWKLWRGHMGAALKFVNQAFWPSAHSVHPGSRLQKLTSL